MLKRYSFLKSFVYQLLHLIEPEALNFSVLWSINYPPHVFVYKVVHNEMLTWAPSSRGHFPRAYCIWGQGGGCARHILWHSLCHVKKCQTQKFTSRDLANENCAQYPDGLRSGYCEPETWSHFLPRNIVIFTSHILIDSVSSASVFRADKW